MIIQICIFLFFISQPLLLHAEDRLTAEAELVSTVAGCVNVVSGDFFQIETDLVVEGVEPLHITRCYDSGHDFDSRTGYRWGLHFPLGVRDLKRSKKYCEAKIDQREGAHYSYKGKLKKGKAELKLPHQIRDKGLSNYSQGGISGQTNIQNVRQSMLDYKLKSQDLKLRSLQEMAHGESMSVTII